MILLENVTDWNTFEVHHESRWTQVCWPKQGKNISGFETVSTTGILEDVLLGSSMPWDLSNFKKKDLFIFSFVWKDRLISSLIFGFLNMHFEIYVILFTTRNAIHGRTIIPYTDQMTAKYSFSIIFLKMPLKIISHVDNKIIISCLSLDSELNSHWFEVPKSVNNQHIFSLHFGLSFLNNWSLHFLWHI